MWNIFTKKKSGVVYAPTKGKVIAIEQVKDEVFSKKMAGDGFAIIPCDGTILAPVNGRIDMIFPTGHAFGITTSDGMEIMVHIGIDTVDDSGHNFSYKKQIGDKVKIGDVIVECNLENLEKKYDMTIITVLTNSQYYSKLNFNLDAGNNEPIVIYSK